MMKNLKIIFMGTSSFATTVLEELLKHYPVSLVVSQPDAKVGRSKTLTPSHTKAFALSQGIEVFTPEKIKIDNKKIFDIKPDLIITCAYGQIIPSEILELPKYGSINVHASLLPLLRGGAPIQRAIMNNFKYTGITIMYMDEQMDHGDIITQEKVSIDAEDTFSTLSKKLSGVGAKLLIETIPHVINEDIKRIKQDASQVTYAKIIKKEDEKIDFSKSAIDVYNQIRALNDKPGAYFLLNGIVMKVYESYINDTKGEIGTINNIYKSGIGIGCADSEIVITKIQPSGKKIMAVKDYLNGTKKESLIGCRVNE